MYYSSQIDFINHAKQLNVPIDSALALLEELLPKHATTIKWGTLYFSIKKGKKSTNICYLILDAGALKIGFPQGWKMMQQGYFDESEHAQVRYVTYSEKVATDQETYDIIKNLILEALEVE
jgi:hypothetical protein